MDVLPIELIRAVASVDIQTYHALITSYPRFARDVPPIPRIGKKDRFDYMIEFGFDVHVYMMWFCDQCTEWTLNGQLHMNGMPAISYSNGSYYWYNHGYLHRDDDQPALEIYNMAGELYSKQWYQHGNVHRGGDKPAKIMANTCEMWIMHGIIHRDNDMPAIVHSDGKREWWQHGKLHRDGAPAIIHADGTEEWFTNDVPISPNSN